MSKAPNKGMIDLTRANKPALPTPEPETTPKEAEAAVAPPKEARVRAPRPETPSPVAEPATIVPRAVAAVEPVSTLGARIPASLHKRIRMYCTEHDVEIQHFVQDALTRHLAALQSGRKAVE